MWGVNDFIYERYEVLRDKHNFTPTKILDIGAHFGGWYKTIKSIYPDSEVLSIEANPNCTTKLSRVNPNSIISCLGVEEGTTQFYINISDPYCTGASMYKEQTEFYEGSTGITLPVVTLDSINQQFDFIKMDVQGAELDVIKGGLNTIQQASVLQLELGMLNYNEGAPKASEIISYLYNLGFDLFDIGSFYYWNNKLNQSDMFFVNREKFNIFIDDYERP
jgi:FkbM family methyltransferase